MRKYRNGYTGMNFRNIILVIFSGMMILHPFTVGLDKGTLLALEKTRTIIDCAGRTVHIPRRVKRIACLYAFSGHAVTMLGRGGDIVAVVGGLKRDVMLTHLCPSIENAIVPRYNGALNVEELLKARPDVVFLKEDMAGKESETSGLDRFHIPWVVISFNSMAEQQKAVAIIGEVIGETRAAADYNSYYRETIDRIGTIVKNIPGDQKLTLYHSTLEPLKTDGPRSLAAEWTRTAGVVNVSAGAEVITSGEDYYATIEQVLLWNPRVILVNEEGVDDYMKNNSLWSHLDAVKQGRIYKMPTGISRWGHPGSLETPLALLWTVKTLYPEYSGSIDLRDETKRFYKNYFNYKLTDTMTDSILSGKGMRTAKSKRNKKK